MRNDGGGVNPSEGTAKRRAKKEKESLHIADYDWSVCTIESNGKKEGTYYVCVRYVIEKHTRIKEQCVVTHFDRY